MYRFVGSCHWMLICRHGLKAARSRIEDIELHLPSQVVPDCAQSIAAFPYSTPSHESSTDRCELFVVPELAWKLRQLGFLGIKGIRLNKNVARSGNGLSNATLQIVGGFNELSHC